jgi:hypothetical protein
MIAATAIAHAAFLTQSLTVSISLGEKIIGVTDPINILKDPFFDASTHFGLKK